MHISALTDRYIADPRDVVKAGDIVKVKVMEVDVPRKRIGLSMRLKDEPGQNQSTRSGGQRTTEKPAKRSNSNADNAMGGAFAAAFAKAKK